MAELRVCVYHRRMADGIADLVRRHHPDVDVEVARDDTADPPSPGTIDVLLANTFPDGMLGRCGRLRWLHLTGTGVDHVAAGRPAPDLVITNSAEVPARAVAEFAWSALLGLAKDTANLVRRHDRRQWRLPDARLVAGSRLVVVGMGRIGTEIARRAEGFDVRVTGVSRSGRPSPVAERVVPSDRLAEVARTADHLVLAVPLTPATRHLADAAVLDALPPHAVVVNVGRAGVLDTDALVRALCDGRLRGAVLDVHAEEPLPPDSPLWAVPNLLVTPHGAYRFPEEEEHVARLFVDNLTALREGRPLRGVVALPASAGAPR